MKNWHFWRIRRRSRGLQRKPSGNVRVRGRSQSRSLFKTKTTHNGFLYSLFCKLLHFSIIYTKYCVSAKEIRAHPLSLVYARVIKSSGSKGMECRYRYQVCGRRSLTFLYKFLTFRGDKKKPEGAFFSTVMTNFV